MTRALDLDTVAPNEQVIMSPKDDTSPSEEINIKNEKIVAKTDVFSDLTKKIYNITGHTKSSLSSLLINPDIFDFEERDSDEKILLVARPHWFTNVPWIITTILLIFIPGLIKFVPIFVNIPNKFQILGIFVWYLITFAFAFEKFISWYFDVYIITNDRVIDIAFNNLIDKKFSQAKITMIQDITSRVIGVGQTMLNYGTVYIQTAAEVAEIQFELVPNPEKIIKVLQVIKEEGDKE